MLLDTHDVCVCVLFVKHHVHLHLNRFVHFDMIDIHRLLKQLGSDRLPDRSERCSDRNRRTGCLRSVPGADPSSGRSRRQNQQNRAPGWPRPCRKHEQHSVAAFSVQRPSSFCSRHCTHGGAAQAGNVRTVETLSPSPNARESLGPACSCGRRRREARIGQARRRTHGLQRRTGFCPRKLARSSVDRDHAGNEQRRWNCRSAVHFSPKDSLTRS